MNIVTIDAGTTNTRSSLWRNGEVIAQSQLEIGVRNTAIEGNNTALRHAVRDTVRSALEQAQVSAKEVVLAVASGMISSALGLAEVLHLPAPAGLAQLAAGMMQIDMPDVFPQPLWLIPGVRNTVAKIGLHNHEAMDMMRGEEAEAMGLLSRLNLSERTMLIMPGSHTKMMAIDEHGCIAGCATTLAGELLQVITQGTVISESLDANFSSTFSAKMVLAGAAAAQNTGLARACFSVRTLAQFTDVARNERANFLLGAVLGSDVLTLKNSSAIQMKPDTPLVITGRPLMRQALGLLIRESGFFYGKCTVVSDAQQANLAGFGAIAIAKARSLLPVAIQSY